MSAKKGAGIRRPGTKERAGERAPGAAKHNPSRSQPTRETRRETIASARRVSYRILLQIVTTDAHSDELLRSSEVDALSAQDRNLTTTLVLGTLRWQLALDARIRELLARPESRLSPEAATALRMGAYQLLHLNRVPAHAVIHDSVELVKTGPERGAAGMVNAVLRKLQGAGTREPSAEKQQGAGRGRQVEQHPADESAERWAHPVWMVERWVRRYGVEAAKAICQWDQEPAATVLRIAPGVDVGDLETEPGAFLKDARRVVRGDVGRSAVVREGRARIQDEGSQLVAEVLAADWPSSRKRFAQDANSSSATGLAGMKVLDLCAAPGGKTSILAEVLPGAEITAVDASRKRLESMKKTMPAALAARMRFEVADASRMELKPEWDLILCDVPCSGTGTMARNPEIRLRVTQEDLTRQQARQAAILQAGLRGLREGGRLVYATCSLEPEENEQVVAEIMRSDPRCRVVPIAGILDRLAETGVVTTEGRERLRQATKGDFLRTLPGMHPCDGFFAAAVEKQEPDRLSRPAESG